MNVPFADLHAQYLSIKPEVDAAIAEVIRTSAFIRGPFVQKFEAEFAAAVGAQHCISCANGTDSLYIAMHALGVKPGDEVLTTAHSWISTSETISQAGGTPVFCDTDAQTFTIDPAQIEARITSRTVGIVPVHLYGQPADMDAIMAIARKHGLWVIEDCAQAHLARYKGQLVGSFGNAASYSFYPGKNLGAMGDAGAITTNDAALAQRMAMFARHGGINKGDHQIEGVNSRLDGLQAAVLSVKLPHLAAWTRRRQAIAQQYDEMLAHTPGVTRPTCASGREHVYHLYVIRHENRDRLVQHLSTQGIQTVISYPVALPFLPCYSRFAHRPEEFPNAHRNQSHIVSIPIFPEMTAAHVARVVEAIGELPA
ncbi:MAG: DegT/DnrJ/EryC1/StrS family aminotransferase [Hydrogenophaga sp.]|jgi:dTDP-4-amino-4,6-dideoxygalactose transaminase|uniref:DegT/DnrJ/EryC1/StrS family aminotransferase n=1 Tax=Hydrogenophaga sp. TaxID=1904254 RepID=UPI00260B234B|nr:DegT/DnrJ/EryC1/StrS family aminotransferase [Hydrogenophaga sp.]MCW5668576.1 DegT/DnrJ/EryC1/StrS family aminotransferase [Hydrogenophaga sp.]